jgi:Bacterial Ig-like domain (group 2)
MVRYCRAAFPLIILMLASCGGSEGPATPAEPEPEPDPTPTVVGVVVAPSAIQLVVGDSTQLTATATSSAGGILQVEFSWTTSDSTVARVSATGMVFANSPGTSVVRASAGGFTGSAAVAVVPPPNEAPIATISAPSDGSSFDRGRSVEFVGEGTDSEDGNIPPERLAWFVDGSLGGSGNRFVSPDLNVGDRLVTLTATDSNGAEGRDSIQVSIIIPVGSDTTVPVLADLQLSKDTLKIGTQPDTLVVSVDLTEDVSGIRFVEAQLLSTTTSQVLGWTELPRVSGDYFDGVFAAPIIFGQNAATGQWDLRVRATDHAGNSLSLTWTDLADRGLPSNVFVRQ